MQKTSRRSAARKPSLLSRLAPGICTFLTFFLIALVTLTNKVLGSFAWFMQAKAAMIQFMQPFLNMETMTVLSVVALIGAALQFNRKTWVNKLGLTLGLVIPLYAFGFAQALAPAESALVVVGLAAFVAGCCMLWVALLYGYFQKHYYSLSEVQKVYHKVVKTNYAFGMPGLPPECQTRTVKSGWNCFVAGYRKVRSPFKFRYTISVNIPKAKTQYCFWLLPLLKSESDSIFTLTTARVEQFYDKTPVEKLPEHRTKLAVAA